MKEVDLSIFRLLLYLCCLCDAERKPDQSKRLNFLDTAVKDKISCKGALIGADHFQLLASEIIRGPHVPTTYDTVSLVVNYLLRGVIIFFLNVKTADQATVIKSLFHRNNNKTNCTSYYF